MLNDLLGNESNTLKEVLKKIDLNGKGTLFIVNETKRLTGIITDGDIRRALLKGHRLEENICYLMNKEFFYAVEGQDIPTIQNIIKKSDYQISIVPIINGDGQLIDYYEFRTSINVPLTQPHILDGNEYKYLSDAFLSTWISSAGSYVPRFEEAFAGYCGVKYGIAVANGTVALHLALVALGIKSGDEVIIPDITFAATINAVLYTGATPVIVDIERESWCIDPVEIQKAITPKTKCIIPVHIYGQPCDMDAIMRIAGQHNLYVVEDCAEAHGAEYDGKKVGSFGDIACFSFFGNKVITTGEGGMCITNSLNLEKEMRILKDHGMSRERKYYHEKIGFNYRMTNLQAAIGTAQTEKIEKILLWRQMLEQRYRSKFEDMTGVELQRNALERRKKITWLVSILVSADFRDSIVSRLKTQGIDVRTFFIPLSEMDIYRPYTFSNKVSKEISARGINLPTIFGLGEDIIDLIGEVLTSLENN